MRNAPSKSTLGCQNKNRNWELFRYYYDVLLETLGQQTHFKRTKFRIKSKIFLLDATTISLCLSLLDWAKYKTKKGAVKMHTLLDYDGYLPAYVNSTDGKTADNKGTYYIPLLQGSVIVTDRFYNDFSLLNVWDSNQVYFVVRHKDTVKFRTTKEPEPPEEGHPHVLKDEIIELRGTKQKQKYPKQLRRVALWDEKNQETIEVITNQRSWTANTITELNKARLEVELFFRDIKQQLHIKSFIGTSYNAVIQIWTALITILILKALKTQAKHGWYLSNIVAFIRLSLFVKVDLHKLPDNPFAKEQPPQNKYIQGVLF